MISVYALKKAIRFPKSHFLQLCWSNYSSAAASSGASIKIPNRIPRGPTDILRALEKTVSYDLTGPSYQYFDDPHLAPYNNRQARIYHLAKSAGKKAARWVRNEHPELFTQVISEPAVMSYMPPTPISAETVNEDMLFQKICNGKVTESIKVYELMQEKNIDVPRDLQLALLELLCFYNSEDPIPMEDEAERYYSPKKVNPTISTWSDHPLVKTLFTSLQDLGSAPYSALVCGLYNYGAKPEGDKIVEEAAQKNIKLDVNAYNARIYRTISLYLKGEEKQELILNILKEMAADGVKPNVGTLNACMDALSRIIFPKKYDFLLQLIADFNNIGIKPSLGTYGLMMRGMVGKNYPHHFLYTFINSILTSLENRELEMRHKSDVLFFDWLAKACAVCESLPCAIKTLELFLHSRNRSMLDGEKKNHFFNNIFHVLSQHADFPTLMKYYRQLCPHAHTPGPDFFTALFEACDVNSAIQEIPEIWKDYLATGNFNEETILKMLEVSVNLTGLPDPAALEVRPVIADLSEKFLLFKIETEETRLFDKVQLTSEMCNPILVLLARGCRWQALQTCLKHMAVKLLWPEEKNITEVLENCYDHNNPNVAVWVFKHCTTTYGTKLGLQATAAKFMQTDFLSEGMKEEVKTIFAGEIDDSSSSSSSSDSDSDDSGSDSSDAESISVPRKPILKPVEVHKPSKN